MPEPGPRAYTDSHAHLSYVLERSGREALDAALAPYRGGEELILDPGVDAGDFPGRLSLFGDLPFVRLAAGIWPDAGPVAGRDAALAELERHVAHPACAAVGECGLDYHWMHGSADGQAALFRGQAELAVAQGKPLMVHSREAHADTLALVRGFAGRIPVIIHCFGYDEAAAREYLACGCWISFAGNLGYRNADGLRAACAIVPEDRLLLETDAPYMNPEPRRGKPSSPADIARTYALAARLRSVDEQTLALAVRRNARALFGPG